MQFSMTNIAAGIASAEAIVQAGPQLASNLGTLYQFAAASMDATESMFAGLAGTAKKSAVLTQVQMLASAIGVDFSSIKSLVSTFIDAVKSAYNAALKALQGSSTTAQPAS